jgi:hypothetical protein
MLQKQPLNINFSQGLDTKTDPFQVQVGKFLSLQNSIFTKGGLLQKRSGYGALSALPNSSSTYLTTFSGNLTAIGNSLQAYSQSSASWVNKGTIQPISLSVLPAARSALNQTQCDSVTTSSGLVCTVYTEVNNGTASYKYVIQDSTTGQNIILPTVIPVGSGTVTGSARVFLLGGFFVIVFTNVISGTSHLQYVAISTSNPTVITSNADIASAYVSSTSLSWDGVVVGQKLYIAYNTTSGGQQVKLTYLSSSLTVAAAQSFSGSTATIMGLCADTSNAASPVIYASFYNSGSSTGFAVAVDQNLNILMTATEIITSGTVNNITATAQSGTLTVAYEVNNTYSYDSSLHSNYLESVSVTLPSTVTTGTVGSTTNFLRSVGLASKAFLMNGTMYILAAYASTLQATYFLSDIKGNIIARFAWENGGGYLATGLPQAQVMGTTVQIPYLYKDLIQSVSTAGLIQSIGAAGTSNIYTQTGINLAFLNFSSETLGSSEIGSNLNLTGGLLWAYDGQTISEQNFHLFPDNIECSWSTSGGSIAAQPNGSTNTNAYYYQVTYEWTDAQGNIIRSTPSVPVAVTTTGSGSTGSITVNIPTLRLTYKSGVKVVIYRWSVANQTYYQVTSITAPTLNNKAADSIAYVDTLADASIVGNSIIYTTGGVVEDVAGPACTVSTLFDDRLWLVDAEDQNLLWFSKQVIEGTPVEMSDLLTFYIAPSTGAQGSTGTLTALAPMDDKLIIFKKDAIYYINGTGPDNTGANNAYNGPIFITSTVGCANQNSIVLMPGGLMFQSDKGIWLLGRDLSTQYIGAAVEEYNSYNVNSAINIPGTNQVRFTLSNGITLMYDYYYQQWGTFVGVPAISSTLYQSLHTYVNSSGQVFQETPGKYQDNGNPVQLSFTTSWLNLAGLQGYQRIYDFYLLGSYVSPHNLCVQVAYDYAPFPSQQSIISPNNYTGPYGSDPTYGSTTPYGGFGSLEQWRIHTQKQTCQSFQITVNEIFNPAFSTTPGAGLTLSGLTCRLGIKKGVRPIKAANTVG